MALSTRRSRVLANQTLNFLVSGRAPGQMGNAHMNIAPYEVLPVTDGHMILAVGNDGQFRSFSRVVGPNACRTDPDFATNAARVRNRERLRTMLVAGWPPFERGTAAGGAGSSQRAGKPHQYDRRHVRRPADRRPRHAASTCPTATARRCPACARRSLMSATPLSSERPAPRLGEHTAEILADLEGPKQ